MTGVRAALDAGLAPVGGDRLDGQQVAAPVAPARVHPDDDVLLAEEHLVPARHVPARGDVVVLDVERRPHDLFGEASFYVEDNDVSTSRNMPCRNEVFLREEDVVVRMDELQPEQAGRML